MRPETYAAFQKNLEDKLHALDYETAHAAGIEGQLGDTLRTVISMNDEGDAMLVEIMATAYRADADLLVLYATVLEYEPEVERELAARVEAWNLACPLGHFGLFAEERQLYYKYSVLVARDSAPDTLADRCFELLEILYGIVSGRYAELEAYAASEEAE